MKKALQTFTIFSLLSTATCLQPTFSLAQAGSLDYSFGTGGKVTLDFANDYDWGTCVAIQTNGKIVMAGYTGFNYQDFALARFNSNGTPDNTFGTEGKVVSDFGDDFEAYPHSIKIQNDGKIVVAGSTLPIGSAYNIALVRYNSDGTMDNTFGIGGLVTTDFTVYTGSDDYGNSVAIQSDNKIVVGGYVDSLPDIEFALVRYNVDGSLDNTFGSGGKTTIPIEGSSSKGNALVIQSDGKIILAGDSNSGSGANVTLIRCKTDGTLDSTFGTNGITITDFGAYGSSASSIALQTDEKIVVAGTYNSGSVLIARYNSDGSLDNSFDDDGKKTTNLNYDVDGMVSMTLQADNKIILASNNFGDTTFYDFAVLRYNTDGSIDSTFGIDGITTTDFNGDWDEGFAVAVQTNGKIVVAGYSFNADNSDFAVVRYNGDAIDEIQSGSSGQQLNILVFPNPFTNEILVNFQMPDADAGEIILFDITGNKILQKEIVDRETRINTENLLPGFYLLQYFDGIKTENFKVVKY